MISLAEHLDNVPVPEETVEEALRSALRAWELVNYQPMAWWRKRVKEGLDRNYRRLVYKDTELSTLRRRQGIIQGIEQIFAELDELAARVEPLQEKLKEYHDRKL
jgi:hypothetical protein